MQARFCTEDFRGNKAEHVMEIYGVEYAESVMDDKGCKRFTMETDKNYYTSDGVDPKAAEELMDKFFNGDNISIGNEFIFEVNAKDSV